jgi:hypothetical protein
MAAARKKTETIGKKTESAVAAKETETAVAAPKKSTRTCKKVAIELQYGEKCVDVTALESKAVAAWAEETGKAKTAAKSINLYVKPEEDTLYYVIEGDSGKVEL